MEWGGVAKRAAVTDRKRKRGGPTERVVGTKYTAGRGSPLHNEKNEREKL